jgi:hypothetical protein
MIWECYAGISRNGESVFWKMDQNNGNNKKRKMLIFLLEDLERRRNVIEDGKVS